MENRFKRAIESLHQEGACPRLQIDLTREGVVCPDFLIEKWGERLVIDLDPSYPLNLAFTAIGVEADLSFGGYVTRCKFPYASIYMIADRASGRGTLFEENLPASMRVTVRPTEPAPAATRERGAGESRRRRRRPRDEGDEAGAQEEVAAEASPAAASPAAVEAVPAAVEVAAVAAKPAEVVAEPEAPVSPDEERARAADRRRAMFKVIDGGK